ncbi:syntaxin family [Cyclospora cayetanensis]|uniref:Syntaxin family n=1 Tax=Cyclospora cayetanensis TaxID=88456 RepID=A0A1D3D8Z3_9EIME|nr:syntaxin family [Cyclospora cayetanensis]
MAPKDRGAVAKGKKGGADKVRKAQAVSKGLKKPNRSSAAKARYSVRFHRPQTLKKQRQPKAPRLSRLWTANPVPALQRNDKYRVLQQPLMTESAIKKIEETNTLVFLCDPRASKRGIREAVKETYGVAAQKINTLIRQTLVGKVVLYVPHLTFRSLDVEQEIAMASFLAASASSDSHTTRHLWRALEQSRSSNCPPPNSRDKSGRLDGEKMMSNNSDDPFYAAREEVEMNFAELQRLHREWKQQIQVRGHPSKCLSLKGTIDSSADALAADLRALDKAVAVASRHQQRLGLHDTEIEKRKAFVQQQQKQLNDLKADIKAAGAPHQWMSEASSSSNEFWGGAEQKQQTLVQQQDEQLDELAHAASRLHETALTINQELETQQRMLTDLDDTLERQGAVEAAAIDAADPEWQLAGNRGSKQEFKRVAV